MNTFFKRVGVTVFCDLWAIESWQHGSTDGAIKKAWTTISLNEIKKYYDSLPNRMFEVIKNKGGHTKS